MLGNKYYFTNKLLSRKCFKSANRVDCDFGKLSFEKQQGMRDNDSTQKTQHTQEYAQGKVRFSCFPHYSKIMLSLLANQMPGIFR